MAEKAILIDDEGNEIPVNALDLSNKDKFKKYICCGLYHGKMCRAKMYYVDGAVQSSHFRALTDHMKNCEFDDSSKFHVVRNIDKTGYNTSVGELAVQFGVDHGLHKKSKKNKSPSGTGIGREKNGEVHTIEDQPDERETLSLQSKPKKLEELCKVLLQVHEDDQYGPDRVGDFFIDSRSVDAFHKQGFQDGAILIFICEKTNHGAELRPSTPDNTLILKAPYSRNFPPLLIKFKTTKKMWKKIVKETKKEDKIAVIGRWYHHPERDDVILCDYLPAKCITVLESELFEEE